jgi:hypothetical protein
MTTRKSPLHQHTEWSVAQILLDLNEASQPFIAEWETRDPEYREYLDWLMSAIHAMYHEGGRAVDREELVYALFLAEFTQEAIDYLKTLPR